MPRLVVDWKDRRSVWAMPAWVPSELKEALPPDWEVVVVQAETDGSGDGAGGIGQELRDAVRGAEVYFGFGVPEGLLDAATALRWAHSAAAGVGKALTPAMIASPVVFTNSAGVHAPPIAETVLAMLLFFGRGLDFAVEGQGRGEWWHDPFFDKDTPVAELAGSTVGIVGFGGIGREVARRLVSLGARVIGLKRRAPAEGEVDLTPVYGTGSLGAMIELVHGEAGLDAVLRESNAVVVSAPETAETRGLLDEDALARMRPDALLVNVARGKIVDQDALVRALSEGRLRGAGLDVFAEEPLPEEHPLWKLPNVLITPHVSAITRGFWRREVDLILRNLQRYLAGAPLDEWENVVDKQAGY